MSRSGLWKTEASFLSWVSLRSGSTRFLERGRRVFCTMEGQIFGSKWTKDGAKNELPT